MIYGSKKWFLKTNPINGETILEGEIIENGSTKQYKFGESVFSSRLELENSLRELYGKQLRQDFS
jgi:hypothetical protein